MWGASQVGQRLAHDQMDALRTELPDAVKDCAPTVNEGAVGA